MANPRLATFIVNKLNRIRGKGEVGARYIVPLQKKQYILSLRVSVTTKAISSKN